LTKEPLSDKFDVIIAGEVLEHLDAPGYLFANLAKMLNDGGKLIISVPNPWYINVILKTIFEGPPYVDNVDHVSWFDPCTISELGIRHGLRLESFFGIFNSKGLGRSYPAKIFFASVPLLIKFGFRPEIFAKTIIYEFVVNQ
jgi:SAM-dependent methyltransferase